MQHLFLHCSNLLSSKENPTTRKSVPDLIQAPDLAELSTKPRTAARVWSFLCRVATLPRNPISRVRRTPAPPERASMLPSPAPPPGRDGPLTSEARKRGPRLVPSRRTPPPALVLGGGTALGPYLAGAYERLHEEGVRPDRIVGASIGAVTGAILGGHPPERRLERLREFWAEAALHTFGAPAPAGPRSRQVYNGSHVALTAMLGRPGLFG